MMSRALVSALALSSIAHAAEDAGYRQFPARAFDLRDFVTAQFDAYDTHIASNVAYQNKINLTTVADSTSLHGEVSYLMTSAYELQTLWRIDFDEASNSTGVMYEHVIDKAATSAEFAGTRASDFLPICHFDMRLVGGDAALSVAMDPVSRRTCFMAAAALNDTRRAHWMLQIADEAGNPLRSIAAHRREMLNKTQQPFMQQYGHFFLIGALLLLQVGVRVWKSSATGRKWEGSGRAAAVAREAAASGAAGRAAAKPAAGAAGGPEAKKDN
jgi:hypothetical protein